MEYAILGWPEDDPTLRLDHEVFSYAGKFVMSNSGKAVARQEDELVAAIAFSEDRTDDETVWLRYVTVRVDRRGEGIGPELVRFTTEKIRARGYRRVKIAVNNPFAYQALSRAGFGWTGEETGLAELVLEHPTEQSKSKYQSGLDVFRERDLSADEESFLAEKRGSKSPSS
ncbi:GNAT family N-acetyltransferase [Haladaptatus pallidirubidus]|uniref:GNAT family N-acetyltransferase n=1 Tax=Haladaptatus pallidirubidus TaxID=1008152 RepID=A0AAV3UAT4_9EURY|nr:GNAT family N-acetyltransferase [Haladaptatus pallidirubidus]